MPAAARRSSGRPIIGGYWDRAEYEAGRFLSFDKQYVRDWLDRSGWNHEPPAPALPDDVVQKTRERYAEAMRRLTGAAG